MEKIVELILNWRRELVLERGKQCLVLGIQGPQGSGKTMLCRKLVEHLQRDHQLRVVSLSIDDFYKSHRELEDLRSTTSNPFLHGRGLPGTHDLALGRQTLQQLISPSPSNVVALPVYDKSTWNGAGDRLPESQWPRVQTTVDIVLVEGWMLGYAPHSPEQLQAIYQSPTSQLPSLLTWAHLQELNENLKLYATEWYPLLDAFLQLCPQSLDWVYAWRQEQERGLRAASRGQGMSEVEVNAFVDRFWPCYQVYNLPMEKVVGRLREVISRPALLACRCTLDKERKVVLLEQVP